MGGFLIGTYFRIVNFGSAFQAAGAFVIIMVGIYFIAQLFLAGAIFTRIFASEYGSLRLTSDV
jgi:membrane protein